ncbi:MAG: choline ABC transporter permease [Herpetosiphonaceae bacterium]|nr:MAG: choline ABC transporter permease [Herpetosiphonaceae bacterium]
MGETLLRAYEYATDHQEEFLRALGEHLLLVGLALGIATLICVPLGIVTSRSRAVAATVINIFNSLRVVPSLAILFLAIPYFGLSLTSAWIALTILALPPILINTDTAFRTINPAIKEVAYGMGMTGQQRLWRVEAPLALPVIIAGIRTATVEVIASATLAAFIGSGGLGIYVTRGFALYDNAILLVGAVPVALLALLAEMVMSRLQRAVQPPA